MDAIDAILTRRSAGKLTGPGPTEQQLATILAAGQAAPDHGRLQPWRFIVIEGKARDALADSLARLRLAKTPDADAETLAKERGKAYRSPTIVAVAASIAPGKIPAIEQEMAAAAATQNMFLAAHALGLGAMWKTGDAAYDATLKAALGLSAEDRIIAFLYLGTRADTDAPAPKAPKDVVRRLPG